MSTDLLHFTADLADPDCLCELPHAPGILPPHADTYLIIPWGYRESPTVSVQTGTHGIPICNECLNALYGGRWVLLACPRCSSMQWVDRECAKHGYPAAPCIVWLSSCPCCANSP